MRRRFAIALAVLLVLAAAAVAWATPQAVQLQLKGEPGQESTYHTAFDFAMDMNVQDPMGGQQLLSLSPRAQGEVVTISRIVDVADNGDLTMGMQIQSFDVTLDVADLHARLAIEGPGGGPPELIKLPPLPIQAVLSNRGELLALDGLDRLPIPPLPGPNGQRINLTQFVDHILDEFSQPEFPEGPVAPGDSWHWEMTINPIEMMEAMGGPMPPEVSGQMGAMSFPLQCTSTLTGFETIDGVECARIEATAPWRLEMPMPGPSGEAVTMRETGTTDVVTWFDYSAGRVVREIANVLVTMTVGTEDVVPARMEMQAEVETQLQ